jgi:gluconolactonase
MNFDAQGRLVVCCDGKDGGARAVRRYEPDGTVTTLASHYNGKRLNAPNDLCFDREGRIYFTDPRYGYKDDLEQDCMAVYRLEVDGSLTRVIADLQTPNGILITPILTTLAGGNSGPFSMTLAMATAAMAWSWISRAISI